MKVRKGDDRNKMDLSCRSLNMSLSTVMHNISFESSNNIIPPPKRFNTYK